MSTDNIFYKCSCYFTDNIYLTDYNIHVRFLDQHQFLSDYKQLLFQRGCNTENKIKQVLFGIEREIKRRKNVGTDSFQRKMEICQNYLPLHPHLYSLEESFLHPKFRELVTYCKQDGVTREAVLEKIEHHDGEKVYSFPVFTLEFCQQFLQLMSHFENSDSPKGRPNTMNQYGVLLDELGLDEGFFVPLREQYLQPIAHVLYPYWAGQGLDSHKAFVVKYKLGEDLSLSYHYDNAEVTLNVSLGAEFVGGELYFGAMTTVPIEETEVTESKHSTGWGIFHRGQHKHGAQPIRSGERFNLIIWMRSSSVRNKLCPMCGNHPDLVETEGTGDGFTLHNEQEDSQLPRTVNVCSVT